MSLGIDGRIPHVGVHLDTLWSVAVEAVADVISRDSRSNGNAGPHARPAAECHCQGHHRRVDRGGVAAGEHHVFARRHEAVFNAGVRTGEDDVRCLCATAAQAHAGTARSGGECD